jgi:CRP-like cAMP-binding protein
VGEVGPGEIVANRPPLDIITRDARVVAQTPMRLLSMPVDAVASKVTHTAVTASIVHAAVARLRRVGASPNGE